MKYEDELVNYLKNTSGCLAFEYTEDFTNTSILFHNALELSKSKNPNERVLSIILYHQSTIEMMKQLIIYSNFLIKLLVFPNQMNFKKIKDEDSYSTIYYCLDNSISFKKKESLLSKIRELNKIRTKVSHHMFKDDFESYSLYDIKKVNDLFELIFDKFQEGFLDLNEKIKKAKQREELIKLLDKK